MSTENRYLGIAQAILRQRRTPLSAREMIRDAQRLGLMPSDLHGKTQYKTLQARLSVDIIVNKDKSCFYRVSPGRFFLREFLDDPAIDYQWKKEYRARRRRKELQKESVLCLSKSIFEQYFFHGLEPKDRFPFFLEKGLWTFVDRKTAERSKDHKQLVTYVVVLRPGEILSYRRGRFNLASDKMRGLRSIGFGGHIAESDVDLITQNEAVALRNAARELMEELALDKLYKDDMSLISDLEIIGYVNDETSEDGEKHLGIVIALEKEDPNFFDAPERGELSILDVRWISRRVLPNDIESFEDWSRHILQKLVFTGGLKDRDE